MTLLSTNWHKSCCTCVKAPGEGRKLRRRIKVDIKIFLSVCFLISDPTSRSSFLIVWTPCPFGLTRCTFAVCLQEIMVVTFNKTSIIKHNFHVSLSHRQIGHFFWLITILDYSFRTFICTLSHVISKSFVAFEMLPWHAKMKSEKKNKGRLFCKQREKSM